ncbi:MAG: T9SS type A sorting domain-containing protein, partial [Flavobacteriales bacterium]|nr:T9SS type A sorting domain-containing protein [Flavobacteriales bacterium]
VGQPFDASMLWIPNDDQAQFIYSNGNAMAIRLSSDATIGVQETANLDGVTLYPSPTDGPVEIRLETPGKMSVEVFNVLGKLVETARFNGTSTKLDLGGNAAGIYTVRISDGARYNVQRITLK